MNKFVALTMLCTLAACDPGLGVSRAGDTISRTGSLDCANTTITSQGMVKGTEQDPVRCGPQTQALP